MMREQGFNLFGYRFSFRTSSAKAWHSHAISAAAPRRFDGTLGEMG